MPAPDPIEATLQRLLPPGLSEAGLGSIEAMLDDLCGGEEPVTAEPVAPASGKPSDKRWSFIASGIAASLAAVLAINVDTNPPLTDLLAMDAPIAAQSTAQGLVLLGGVNRIEEMSDAGWIAAPDGMAMEATRIRLVEANTYRDEETGVLVEVSEPREEILLTPITAF
jgi:hypothetical protein